MGPDPAVAAIRRAVRLAVAALDGSAHGPSNGGSAAALTRVPGEPGDDTSRDTPRAGSSGPGEVASDDRSSRSEAASSDRSRRFEVASGDGDRQFEVASGDGGRRLEVASSDRSRRSEVASGDGDRRLEVPSGDGDRRFEVASGDGDQRLEVAPGDRSRRLLVALSGGPDSVALAAATAFVADRDALSAGAVIIDHGLQDGSAVVAARAAALAYELGLDPVQLVRVDVETGPAAGGPEGAARTARYRALDDAAAAHDSLILLGHTRDDQAETVLLGLGRGSGPRSIAGMRRREGRYLRPFLDIDRATTERACAALGLPVWHDPHNLDPSFRRVRLRREVLPLLEDVLGGESPRPLARTADQLRADVDALDLLARKPSARESSARERSDGEQRPRAAPASTSPASTAPAGTAPGKAAPANAATGGAAPANAATGGSSAGGGSDAGEHTAREHTAREHTAREHTGQKHTGQKHSAGERSADERSAVAHQETLAVADLRGEPEALQARLLRGWAMAHGAGPLTAAHVRALTALVTTDGGREGRQAHLPGGYVAVRRSGRLQMHRIEVHSDSHRPG